MKHIHYSVIGFFMVALFLFSCKKFLDEKSNKSLVVIKTVDDLQSLLDDDRTMNSQTPGFGQTSDDDYFVTLESYNSAGDFDQRAYTWRLEKYRYPNDWSSSYNAIYNANYCLEQIEKIGETQQNETKWNNVRGSALFYRGFYFLNLLWEYSKAFDQSTSQKDLGIVLRLGSNFNVPSNRASVKTSYEQVIKDLKESLIYLPDFPQHVMRPSKAASYAALARAYLSMSIYDSASKFADLSLSIKGDLLDYNSAGVNVSSNVPFKRYNIETIFYATQSGNYTTKYSFYALADSLLYAAYNTNDLRKKTYFFSNSGGYSFKGSYASDMYLFFSGIATDEMFLTRAECNARMGRLSDALEDLNLLLSKRYATGTFLPYSTTDQTEVINLILKERRKELTMRGLRWIDIKRLNKQGANIILKRIVGSEIYTLAPNDNKFALPLPQDIIETTGVQQN